MMMSEADHTFFDEQGYLVIPGLVPQAMCDALIDGMHDFIGGADRSRWYAPPFKPWGGLEMYQHPAMWAIRQYPPMHQVFSELIGTPKLWVTMDRLSYKLPNKPDDPEHAHEGFMHWDCDIREVVREGHHGSVQGVLSLTDTAADQGGFQCIPGIHQRLAAFIETQGADFDGRDACFDDETFTPIPTQAGDLIIWSTALAHGNTMNATDRPRLAMYVSMFPITEERRQQRADRVAAFNERRQPGGFPGDERKWESQQMLPMELTELGRRLLGMEEWPE